MHTQNKGKISHAFQAISIIPLIFAGLAIMLFGSHLITRIMHDEVAEGLQNVAQSTTTLLDTAYPGDYELVSVGNGGYRLHKGGQDITEAYSLVDRVKNDTGMDVSLFFQDTRILTTIYTSDGKRNVGTSAPSRVLQDVFQTGTPCFYDNTLINNSSYFAYYAPLYNSDGSVTGMLFIGRPSASVEEAVENAIFPLMILVAITMLVTGICIFFYTRNIVQALTKIRVFLTRVTGGNAYAELDASVSLRRDELGEIGRSAVSMQNALRTMIEQDALTGLFNRRSINRKLQQIIAKNSKQHSSFSIAIGDIDFFKKINDTYGHEAGDEVLKNVAAILQEHMADYGFVARWGGEEFLLVFDQMNLLAARDSLELLLDRIRALETNYNDQIIKVTMTFGVTSEDTENADTLFRLADEKLYFGKTNGRNQVVI